MKELIGNYHFFNDDHFCLPLGLEHQEMRVHHTAKALNNVHTQDMESLPSYVLTLNLLLFIWGNV